MPNSWEQVVSPLSRRLPLAPRPGLARRGLPVAGCLPSGCGPVSAEVRLRQTTAAGRPGLAAPAAELFLNVRLLPHARLIPAGMGGRTRGVLIAQAAQAVPGASVPQGDGGILPPALPTAFPGARSLGGTRSFCRAPLIHPKWRLADPAKSLAARERVGAMRIPEAIDAVGLVPEERSCE